MVIIGGARAVEIRNLIDTWREFWAGLDQEEREYAERVVEEREREDLIMNLGEQELLSWEDELPS